MRGKMTTLILVAVVLSFSQGAQASSWTGHYSIKTTITQKGVGHYLFQYEVTNLDQGSGWPQGFDGFFIQVPLSATILNITNPPPYLSGGYPAGYWNNYLGYHLEGDPPPEWPFGATLQSGYQWLWWWGLNEPSVYPVGTTAIFSVELDNVLVGYNDGVVVTYWKSKT
jgi:hypothetical protein